MAVAVDQANEYEFTGLLGSSIEIESEREISVLPEPQYKSKIFLA